MTIIDKLRELEAKATAGPWAYSPYGDENTCGVGVVMDANDEPIVGLDETEDSIVVESVAPEVEGHANAALIAAMRNALPALLRVAEAARVAFDDYKMLVDSGDCGNWTIDDEPKWVELRAALSALEVGHG